MMMMMMILLGTINGF